MAEYDSFQSWLDSVGYSHSNSPATTQIYTTSFSRFLRFIGKAKEEIMKEYDRTTDRQFRRKYAQYLRAWIGSLKREGYATNTISLLVYAVKSYFKHNDLPLGYVAMAQNSVEFPNRDISKEEIAQVLSVSKPRDRAFFMFMAQSGLRVHTITRLQMKHLEPKWNRRRAPCKVEVPKKLAKGKFRGHFTFLGAEAVKFLNYYLRSRSKLNKESFIFTSHGTEKPLNRVSISQRFRDAVRRLKQKGLIDFEVRGDRKPSELRLYNLRKFFRKYAGQAGVEYVNFWMGHNANYLAAHIPASDEHYFSREDVEFQRQLYKEKAMPFLRIEKDTPTETEQTINELRRELEYERRQREIKDKEMAQLRDGLTVLTPLLEFAQRNPEALQKFLSKLTPEKKSRVQVAIQNRRVKWLDRIIRDRNVQDKVQAVTRKHRERLTHG